MLPRLAASIALLLFTALLAWPQAARVITTFAGRDWFFEFNGRPAIEAPMSANIQRIAMDRSGNVYVADPDNGLVLRIDPAGSTRIIAGNGIEGYSGDGGPAVDASLYYPFAIAVDRNGNVFFADAFNYVIRRVGTDGIITTVAGNGVEDDAGDGGPAISASFGFIRDLAFDNDGNLYVVDSGNNRIRVIRPNGRVDGFAGNGDFGEGGLGGQALSAELQIPYAVAIDRNGEVYIGEFYDRILKVSRSGVISRYAGTGNTGDTGDGGPALLATFDVVFALAFDANDNLYVSDSDNYTVRRISPTGTITKVAGNGEFGFSGDGGAPLQARFRFTCGLATTPGGDVLVVDRGNARIRRIVVEHSINTVAGNGLFRSTPDGTLASQAYLFQPSDVAFDRGGRMYVSDTSNHVIRRLGTNGRFEKVAGLGFRSYGPENVDARQSGIQLPAGLAFAPNGDLIFADRGNGMIRRVDANGIISRVAGGGGADGNGDGGPGINARLRLPRGLAFDSQGVLYIAEEDGHRVRRLAVNGIISTFAGTGTNGSTGDGGLATAAQLSVPTSVVLDRAGNVYIGEFGGCRIRRVTADNRISTFAGTGTCGYSGDGGAAVSAQIGSVYGLLFDANGNLIFSDNFGHRVRQISPSGVISTIAGNGIAAYDGDGGPANRASLFSPVGMTLDPAGNLYIADFGNNRIRSVLTAIPAFSAAPTQLTFSAASGAAQGTPQIVNLNAILGGQAFGGVPYSATASDTWLSVSPASGNMPARLEVRVDPSRLAAGSYTGTVRITAAGTQTGSVTIPVALTVTGARPPQLSLGSANLAFSLQRGAGEAQRQLVISNSGGGSLTVQVVAATSTGGNWLIASPNSDTVTPSTPLTVNVTANAGQLAAGTYSGTIRVTSNGGNLNIPVSLTITSAQSVLLLSQVGMQFVAVAGGGRPLGQQLAVLNTGAGSMNWQARSATLSGGGAWLRLGATNGTVPRPFVDLANIDVTVSADGLAAGTYFGQIDVTSGTADNSPQSVSVVLNVLPAGTNPGPEVQPTALVFVGNAARNPGSQNILISNPTSQPVSFGSSRTFLRPGGNWFVHVPSEGTVPPNDPARIVVQAEFAGLEPGAIRSFLNLGFADGSSRTVNVLTVVPPPDAFSDKSGLLGASSCRTNGLRVEITSLQRPQFTATIGQPTRLDAKIVDDCGNPLVPEGNRSAVVQAGFTNGDRRLDLNHVGAGVWAGTWTPRSGNGPVTIDITAFLALSGRTQAGQASHSGLLTQPGLLRSPLMAPGGVANAASGENAVVSPGGYISIYGAQLADRTQQAQSIPLPTEMEGTEVMLAGRKLPLSFVGDGQVNALVPYDLSVNTQHQILVKRGSALSVPENVTVAPAQPAIYTQDQSGRGPGVIVNGVTNQLITAQNPARAGDVLVLYCNGLGTVNPVVPPGAAAPLAGPLSRTTTPVTVRIGGVNATVNFSGLAPGFPGLYQVNAVVPAGLTPGDAVPVTLEISGQVSPPVTIVLR